MRIPPEDAKRARGVELLGAVARQVAHPVATYYRALRDEGVPPEDARFLAAEFGKKLLDDILLHSQHG